MPARWRHPTRLRRALQTLRLPLHALVLAPAPVLAHLVPPLTTARRRLARLLPRQLAELAGARRIPYLLLQRRLLLLLPLLLRPPLLPLLPLLLPLRLQSALRQ